MFRSVARNFSIVTAADVTNAAVMFVFLAFVARFLGPSLFGTYILVGAYVQVVYLIVNAGVGPIAIRELARERDAPTTLFNDILSLRLALCAAGYLGLIVVLLVLEEEPEILVLVALQGIILFVNPFKESFEAWYTANERMGVPSMIGVGLTVLASVIGAGLVLAGHELLALIATSVTVSSTGTVAWAVRFRARELPFRLSFVPAQWRRLVALVIPFAPIHAANQLNRVVNVVLLGHVPGPLPAQQAVGFYTPAQHVTNTIVRLVMGLRRVLIPAVARRLSAGHTVTRELDLAIKIVFALFALPLLLGTTFMSQEIVSLLFGARFAPTADALQVLAFSGALQLIALVPESFLFSHPEHKLKHYIPGSLLSVLCNVVLCIALIGAYGFLGAAVAAVAGRVVYLLFAMRYCSRALPGHAPRLRNFGDLLVLSIVSLALWYVVFRWLAHGWLAFALAGAATLPLIGAFLLLLRARVIASDSA